MSAYLCNLQKLWDRKFVFAHPVCLNGMQVKFVYEGYWVKVTGAKKGGKSHNVKLWFGNNCGSIKHGAMTFECNKGCLAMADQMVWPPVCHMSDWKWPHITKYMLSVCHMSDWKWPHITKYMLLRESVTTTVATTSGFSRAVNIAVLVLLPIVLVILLSIGATVADPGIWNGGGGLSLPFPKIPFLLLPDLFFPLSFLLPSSSSRLKVAP